MPRFRRRVAGHRFRPRPMASTGRSSAGPSRRRRRGGAAAAAASTADVVGPKERESEERAARAVSALAGVRSLAATPTNGVVAVPLDARRRRRRRRLRARSRRAEPSRHDTDGRAADTHLRQSRAVVRLPVVRGVA